jgi:hypothetical protein
MSDVGVLSYEYEQANHLAQRLEEVLDLQSRTDVSRQQRAELARVLEGLLALLDPLSGSHADPSLALDVPPGLVRRLRKQRVGKGSFSVALKSSAERLADWDEPLRDEDFDVLQKMANATEREVSTMFRRMVRR